MRPWLLAALLLWLTGLPVGAAEIEIQAHAALGRSVRVGDPVPLSVELSNGGPTRIVRVQARPVPASGGDSEGLPRAEATTELAPGGRKRLTLLVPPIRGSSEVEVTAWEGRRLLARSLVSLDLVFYKSRITVVLTSEPGAFSWLAAQTWDGSKQGEPLTVNEVSPQSFPEEAASLAGVDLLVLHDLSRLFLSTRAQGAVADWVRAGGRLLVFAAPDPAEFRGSPLEPLLPIRPAGTATAEGLPILTGLLDRGRVLQFRAGLPFVTVAPRVAGVVGLVGTPLPTTDILGSTATGDLLRSFATECDRLAEEFPTLPEDPGLLNAPPELEPPNLALVAWGMLGYVLVVGPVNWMVLRRVDRMLAVFLTVPALAGGFAVLTFLGGWMVRGSDLLLLESGQVALRSGEASARWQGAVALYSPQTTEYTLTFPLNLRLAEDRGGDPLMWPGFSLVLASRQELRSLEMRMWSMRRFRGQRALLLRGPLGLEADGQGLVAWNSSELDLSDCVLVFRNHSSAPFDLAPGARVERALPSPGPLAPVPPKTSGPRSRYQAEHRLLLQHASKYQASHPSTPFLMGWVRTRASGVECSNPKARETVLNLVVVQGEELP